MERRGTAGAILLAAVLVLCTRATAADPPAERLLLGFEADEVRRIVQALKFPEGGNFTRARHERAIERLDEAGLTDSAERARALRHLLPPRPGGAFAAIDACPDADVLFVAHTGLEQLSSPKDLWRGLPMDREVRLHYWTVRQHEVPTDPDERVRWLFDWWARIDDWIEQRHDPDRPATPKVSAS